LVFISFGSSLLPTDLPLNVDGTTVDSLHTYLSVREEINSMRIVEEIIKKGRKKPQQTPLNWREEEKRGS
jgi:hypothetical protein